MNAEEFQARWAQWWAIFPEWLRHAYYTDTTTHSTVTQCLHAGDSATEMLIRLCGKLYEQRNGWKETALEQARRAPLVIDMVRSKDQP